MQYVMKAIMKAVFALLVMVVILLSGSMLVVESRQMIHEHTTTTPRDDIEVIVPSAIANINNASSLDQLLGKKSSSTLLHNPSFSRRGLNLWIPAVNKERVVLMSGSLVRGSNKEDMHVMAPEMPTNMKVCTNPGICYMKKLLCPHMCGGGLLQKKHVVQGTGSCVFDCHKCIVHC